VVRVLREDATLDPAFDPGLSEEEVVGLYRSMLRARVLDERLSVLQRQGRIGFHVGSIGEEASIIGAAYATRPQDWLFLCYRELGAALLRGMSLQRYIDTSFANANDPAKGRQMPDHYFSRRAHIASVSSPVGTQITHAVGFAWAARLKKDDAAALVYFGDGGTSSSDFHSGMNFAGVFKAPTIFLCRNNGLAISVPTERQTASAGFAEKGIAYGVPGVRVDGNDLFAVIKVTRDAVARASRGDGATLIEAMTYRLSGHSTSDDPKVYRSDAALEPWKRLDPIPRLRRYLDRTIGWPDSNDRAIEHEIESEIRAAVAAAEKASPPSLDSLFDDVYAELPWHLRDQRDELRRALGPSRL
jgi:2-oxoisovalerate dehydrogenase E1 component alpha subunit